MAIEAFRMGLHRGSPLYRELTMYPCQTIGDIKKKAMAFVRLEEDEDQEQGTADRVERRNNEAQRSAQRPTPYSKSSIVNATSERSDIALASYPEIHT